MDGSTIIEPSSWDAGTSPTRPEDHWLERARASRVPPPDPATTRGLRLRWDRWHRLVEIQGILLQDPWPLQGEASRPTSSRRAVPPERGPRRPRYHRRHPGVYRHRLPRIRRRTGRRVDPLVGHRDALDLATRAAAAVVDLLRGHHTYLEGQLIWSGETVLSVRKHCWTDCKLRTRNCGSESTHSKPRRTSSRGIVSFMVKPAWLSSGTSGSSSSNRWGIFRDTTTRPGVPLKGLPVVV